MLGLLFFISIFGWGAFFLQRLKMRMIWGGAYPLGVLVIGSVTAVLNLAHLLSIWSAVLLLLPGVFLFGRFLYLQRADVKSVTLTKWVLWPGILSCAGLILSTAPPVRVDSLVYHLALPKLYISAGGWVDVPENIYSYFPSLMESLYLLFMTFGGDSPQVLHTITGIMVLPLTWLLADRCGLSHRFAWVAVVGVLLTPEFFKEMTWAYVDLTEVLFWAWGLFLFIEWREDENKVLPFIMGAACAGAVSVKYTGLLFPLILVLLVSWELREKKVSGVTGICHLLSIGGVCVVFCAWWMVRNWMASGNPLFPFFTQLFSSEHSVWIPGRIRQFMLFVNQYGGAGDVSAMGRLQGVPLLFFTALQSLQSRFDGVFNCWFLLAFGSLFFLRKNKFLPVLWIILLIKGAFWVFSTQQVRFALETVPFFSIAAAFVLQESYRFFRKGRYILWGVFYITCLVNLLVLGSYFFEKKYWVGVQPSKQEAYLNARLPYAGVYNYIHEYIAEDAVIGMLLTGAQTYYLDRPFFTDTVFEERRFKEILMESSCEEEVLGRMRHEGWDYVLTYLPVYQPNTWLELEYQPLLKRLFSERLKLIHVQNGYALFKVPSPGTD